MIEKQNDLNLNNTIMEQNNSKKNNIILLIFCLLIIRGTQVVNSQPENNSRHEKNGPVLWLKFNEENGSTATDFSGNGSDASFKGNPMWVKGIIDNTVSNESGRISAIVSNTFSIDISGKEITIAGWIKVPDNKRDHRVIFCKPYFENDVAEKTWTFSYYSYALVYYGNYISLHLGREKT